jgi:phosphopantetheinyl transferase
VRQQQSEAAWGLANALLPSGEWIKSSDDHGRPRIVDPRGALGPDVSLSHSHGWCAAMIGEGRVGIDIEAVGTPRNWADIARAYFSRAEQAAVEHDGEPAFLAFWTLREAVAKLGGDGLAAALAVDGDAVVSGRNGVCRDRGWVAVHRQSSGFHLACAWQPAKCNQNADNIIHDVVTRAIGDCGVIINEIASGEPST